MNSQEEKNHKVRILPPEGLVSPFLEGELFTRETGAEWEARLAALEVESPFRQAFEENAEYAIEPEFHEERKESYSAEFEDILDNENVQENENWGMSYDDEIVEEYKDSIEGFVDDESKYRRGLAERGVKYPSSAMNQEEMGDRQLFEELLFDTERDPTYSSRPSPSELLRVWIKNFDKKREWDCAEITYFMRDVLLKNRNCGKGTMLYKKGDGKKFIPDSNLMKEAYSRGWGKPYQNPMRKGLNPRLDHITKVGDKFYMKIYEGEYIDGDESLQPYVLVELRPGMLIYSAQNAGYVSEDDKTLRWYLRHMVTYLKDGFVLESLRKPDGEDEYNHKNYYNLRNMRLEFSFDEKEKIKSVRNGKYPHLRLGEKEDKGQYELTAFSDMNRHEVKPWEKHPNMPAREDVSEKKGQFHVVMSIFDPYSNCDSTEPEVIYFRSGQIVDRPLPSSPSSSTDTVTRYFPHLVIANAIEKNRRYAQSLGWDHQRYEIYTLLGFTDISPSEELFAEAVASWQKENGFTGKDVDGVIGPNTWQKMKSQLTLNGKNGFTPTSPLPSTKTVAGYFPHLVIANAIEKNRRYAQSLGWDNHRYAIYTLLGFTDISPIEELFVEAVAGWQKENGFTGKDVDGVIGPNTWQKMKGQLALSGKNGQSSSTTAQSTPQASQRTASGGSGQASLKTIYNPVLVQWIQNSLNRLLLPNPPLYTDGKFGKKTNPVLENFQRSYGISPIGEINERTLTELENRNGGSLTVPSDPTSDLRFIQWVQMALNLIYYRPSKRKCGFAHPGGLEVDGKFGDGTKSAIREFQAHYPSELSATGSLDDKTIVKLFEVTAERPTKIDGSPLDIKVQVYEGMNWIDRKYTGNDILLPFLKGWVEQESGGQITSWTRLDERGYMQLFPEESENLCIDHLRLSWDWNYSFTQGLVYIRNYMKIVDRLSFSRNTDLYWRLTKLCHWTSGGVQRVVAYMKTKNFIPQNRTWIEFEQFIETNYNQVRKVAGIDPNKGLTNVNATIDKARNYGYNLQ
ncbi:hypothetical protein FBQ85_01065 [Cytophagia bacterium CHB2]|nr:hypothetical protein [Cytophagia bacterium CHB2]